MTNDDLLLLQTSVFTGITTDEIRDMLSCLSARETTFIKDEIIFSYGENITSIGIVLEGSVHIVKEDFWGNANRWQNVSRAIFSGKPMRSIPPNLWK